MKYWSPLRALKESILATNEGGNLEAENEESEDSWRPCQITRMWRFAEWNRVTLRKSRGVTPVINAKLPESHIKRFAGDPKDWQSFWESFRSAVDTNSSLTNVDKFNYLRSLLEGPALNATTGLSLTRLRYEEAIEILTERFGNKQLIISAHVEALLKLKPLNVMTDLKRIRAVLNKFEIQVRGLQARNRCRAIWYSFDTNI